MDVHCLSKSNINTKTPILLQIYVHCIWTSECLSAYMCVSGLQFVWTWSPLVNMWYVVVWPREPVIEGNAILDVCTGHKDHILFSSIWQFLQSLRAGDGRYTRQPFFKQGGLWAKICVAGQSEDRGLQDSLFLNRGRARIVVYGPAFFWTRAGQPIFPTGRSVHPWYVSVDNPFQRSWRNEKNRNYA